MGGRLADLRGRCALLLPIEGNLTFTRPRQRTVRCKAAERHRTEIDNHAQRRIHACSEARFGACGPFPTPVLPRPVIRRSCGVEAWANSHFADHSAVRRSFESTQQLRSRAGGRAENRRLHLFFPPLCCCHSHIVWNFSCLACLEI